MRISGLAATSTGTNTRNPTQLAQVQRKLLIACILCVIFMLVEVVGGYLAHR